MNRRRPSLRSAVVTGLLCLASCSSNAPASVSGEPDTDPSSSTVNETTETTGTAVGQSGAQATGELTGRDDFPDIIGVQATPEDGGTWRFDVTVSSPYDSRERYADAWRVVGPDGTEFGLRILTHDHASEQPFTRSQGGIAVPDGVNTVTVEGRDLTNGWGGGTLAVQLG
jgi:hypothetical protein